MQSLRAFLVLSLVQVEKVGGELKVKGEGIFFFILSSGENVTNFVKKNPFGDVSDSLSVRLCTDIASTRLI